MDDKYLNYKFQVSAFCDVWDVNNNNQNKNYDAEFILDIIRTGNKGVANKINAIRKATTKEERDKLKQRLQTVMWQGIFAERNNNSCLSLSGLVCIDVDHVDEHELDRIKQTLSGWSCVLAFFTSPSGDGLKVIIKTDNNSIDDYGNCYRQVEQLFTDAFGIQPDSRCEDLSHPCYISYDPGIYYNPNATSWHYEHKPEFDRILEQQSHQGPNDGTVLELSPYDKFMAQMNKIRCPLTDEQIITILDIKWSKFPKNYQDGHRTKSVFAQACGLCKAGIEMEKALDYLESKFLPTGFDKDKVGRAVYNAYEMNKHLFGSERSNYRSYNEYKLGH